VTYEAQGKIIEARASAHRLLFAVHVYCAAMIEYAEVVRKAADAEHAVVSVELLALRDSAPIDKNSGAVSNAMRNQDIVSAHDVVEAARVAMVKADREREVALAAAGRAMTGGE
jgi:hypothetical protein